MSFPQSDSVRVNKEALLNLISFAAYVKDKSHHEWSDAECRNVVVGCACDTLRDLKRLDPDVHLMYAWLI